ncbi:circularly permuted type 2 ATP-grasp protein [Acidiphilium sp. PA]|uniref:circularly permuted type 2 ATP-grasp protein n=1 Tax=Acidiphilium sp. PA TaxID=2871705 RepID=UPI0022433233|nr:circularly permuted type 2 ATP-grasp protein [Acidiphilium sp. PA]MCW8306546.1 circularly permuted type 2 ATP-grasp protein [Acidiphilium sp. PA]
MLGGDAIGGLIDAKGQIRAPWRPVINAMRAIGPDEFAARAAALDRRAQYESPSGIARSLRLDPIPIPLMDFEFATLAEAIVERAEFLADVLDDVYGAQSLIADGSLPGDPLFETPQFIRQLARQPGFTAPRLASYAVDLIRYPDGGFRVLRDHTDRAPGLGLALAIRRFVADVMPELFGAVTLASQRPVIETLQDMLHVMAAGGPIGLIAEADADMADTRLLARQLGGTVLRPDDLSCSGGAVRLRTLAGSTPVHLLLRQASSLSIDPLEQGGPPSHGVPGLFRALRNNALTMLNIPGSGVLQLPEFKSCFSNLFYRLRGRPLQLGDHEGASLGTIDADQAPIAIRLTQDGAAARFEFAAITVRLYALRIDGFWLVLPGGLGHATRTDGSVLIKDLWVIDSGDRDAEEPDRASRGPAHRNAPRTTRKAAMDLPSRLADDLLWLGRMVERLDGAARLLAIALPRFVDASNLPHEAAQRESLAACLVSAKLIPDEIIGPFLSARRLHESLGRTKPLTRLLTDIRRLLDQCGERFSISMRRIIEGALDQIPLALSDDCRTFTACMQFVATFNGVIAEDASRSGGFVFLEIGRRLERAEALAETLTVLLAGSLARLDPSLALAIELADAQLTYEFVNAGPLLPETAIGLLIGAADYPRSLAFQTEALGLALRRIGAFERAVAADRITVDLRRLSGAVAARDAVDLTETLKQCISSLDMLADDLATEYFAPIPPSRQVEDVQQATLPKI